MLKLDWQKGREKITSNRRIFPQLSSHLVKPLTQRKGGGGFIFIIGEWRKYQTRSNHDGWIIAVVSELYDSVGLGW